MTNEKVYLKKLKLNPKYLNNKAIALMLMKPGTLSKKEKEWLCSYVAILELKDIVSPEIRRDRLSNEFIKSLTKEK